MVKKINQKAVVPMRHGNIVFNLIFYFNFFHHYFIIIIYFIQ